MTLTTERMVMNKDFLMQLIQTRVDALGIAVEMEDVTAKK